MVLRSHRTHWLPVFRLALGLALGLLVALPGGLTAFARGQAPQRPLDTPSASLISPSSASGPVQTGIHVKGQGWTPNDAIQLYYNPANCGNPATPIPTQALQTTAPVTADSSGNWFADFQWPATQNGAFAICAYDPATPTQVIPADKPFTVLSTTPPSIDHHMQLLPNAGDQITIFGASFLPGGQVIDLRLAPSLASQNQSVDFGTATSDAGGGFAQNVTLPATASGTMVLIAVSQGGVPNVTFPPFFVSTDITIEAVTPTPTASPTGTATPDPTVPPTAVPTQVVTPTTTTRSSGSAFLIFLVVLLVLVILAIFGVLIWYFAGIRPPADGTPPPQPPARTRVSAAPRAGPRSRTAQTWEEDEWEEQQGPWEEDRQGGWNSGEWGTGSGQRERGSPPPRRSGTPPQGMGFGGPPRQPRPKGGREEWPGRSYPDQDGW